MNLTLAGAKLLESAVQAKHAPPSALAIPYGNLASMHEQLGNGGEATRFGGMAKQHETTQRK